MSDNNEFIHAELQRVSSPRPSFVDDAVNPEEDRASNSVAEPFSGDTSLTLEETEAEMDAHFWDGFSEEFRHQAHELFARAVAAATESLEEQLQETEANAFVIAERLLAVEQELVFQEVTQGIVATDRERLRTQVEHLEFEDPDTYKKALLNEKRRLFPYIARGVHAHGTADALHEINEEFSDQPARPTDRLMAASMSAITKTKLSF